MTRHSLDCQTAVVIFRITHEDRAGPSGTDTMRQGEIVSTMNGEAIIAAESGDIVRVPVSALHRMDESFATLWQVKHDPEPDFIAAQELIRSFPPGKEAFMCRWLDHDEVLKVAAGATK